MLSHGIEDPHTYLRDDGDVTYEELHQRLMPEALDLLQQMAAAHLASDSKDRLFILSLSLGGPTVLVSPEPVGQIVDFDRGALDDLVAYGLLTPGFGTRGTPNYRVSGEGILFYRWSMRRLGEPIDQVECHTMRLLQSSVFAQAHPGASRLLKRAFELLWSDSVDEQTVGEIGDHLRKALFDLVDDLLGDGSGRERPIERLNRAIQDSAAPGSRESELLVSLVDLTRQVLRVDNRLAHIRDEVEQGAPLSGREELRRAAFLTVVACAELHAALH